MADRALIVDGFDTSALGVVVESGLGGWRSTVQARYPSVSVPGRIGVVRTTVRAEIGARTIRVPCVVEGATRAEVMGRLDELQARLAPSTVPKTVVLVDDETVQIDALVTGVDVSGVRPDLSQRGVRATVLLEADDPRWYSVTEEAVAFGAATAMPQGTAPVEPVVRLEGSATNPTLTYRTAGGVLVEQMEFTVSLGASDWLDVDMRHMTIVDQAGANRPETLTAGNYFRLDPEDGDYAASSWPTLEVSSGTGTATYRRAWWS